MILGGWTEYSLLLETKLINLLQPRSYYLEKILQTVSAGSDPNNVVFFVYPCIAAFCSPSSTLPFELMLVGSLLTWTSTHLKWAFRGNRPFWWVKEVAQAHPNIPVLRQTRYTCVANPGNPSAHVMVSAGILLILVNSIVSTKKKLCCGGLKCHMEPWCRRTIGFWILYVVPVVIVMFSRIYSASNFPHQCLLGAVLGGLLANTLHTKLELEWQKKQQQPWKILVYALLPVILSFGSYWLQKAFDIDPQKSVRLAFKWCFSPHDIQVSTTPVYSLTCCCGSLFGLGVASLLQRVAVRLFTNNPKVGKDLTFHSFYTDRSWLFNLCNGLGIFITAYILFQLQKQIPTESVTLFYLHHFAVNFAMPILFFAFVPGVLRIIAEKLKVKKD